MKSFIITFLLIANIITINGQQEALDYLEKINEEINKVTRKSMDYSIFSVNSDDERKIDNERKKVILQVNHSIKEMEKMDNYEGNRKLRNEAIDVLELYNEAYTMDYNEAILLAKDRESSYEAMEKYYEALDKAENKINAAADKFKNAQQKFADEYNIILTFDNDTKQKMLKINSVNQYARKIYLAYFMVSKQNGILLDEINRKKFNKIEDERKSLLQACRKSKGIITTVGGYNGDRSYMEATMDVIVFFRELAMNEYEELEKIMEKEKKNQLTKDDVDRFNKIIADYNVDIKNITDRMDRKSKIFKKTHFPKGN